MWTPKTPPSPPTSGVGGKKYRFFLAVREISWIFETLTRKTPNPRVGWGFNFCLFSGQFKTYPGLLIEFFTVQNRFGVG